MPLESFKASFRSYVQHLQDEICQALAQRDGQAGFQEDEWQREEGGGGRTRVLEDGALIEKGGVNISEVYGPISENLKAQLGVEDGAFWVTGLSLIIHPHSPMIPTTHANFRYFELYDAAEGGTLYDAWFGGGIDLTPYYLWDEDARHFHRVQQEACDRFGPALYPEFKRWCDDYFYNHHRGEGRGIGGTFFDYLRDSETMSLRQWHDFTRAMGDSFLPAYLPILDARRSVPYTEEHRRWQELRRGRYVEFNLLWDRGTRFGIQSNGRTKSILMSLPPRCRWAYADEPAAGTHEAYVLDVLRHPRDWLGLSADLEGGNGQDA
jgi:coproporphyrinogen III oxidase